MQILKLLDTYPKAVDEIFEAMKIRGSQIELSELLERLIPAIGFCIIGL